MGWVDNLDKELETEKKTRKRNENKTTCKTVSFPKENAPRTNCKIPIAQTQRTTVGAIEEKDQDKNLKETCKNNEPDEKQEEKDESKSAIALFADRVTVAGVEDAYKAKTKWERWMWYFVLTTALSMAIFTAVNIAKKYLAPQTVYDYYPIANFQPPFPNVTLCAPFTWNQTKFQEYLLIPNHTQSLIKRNRLRLQEIIDYTLDFWRYDQYPRIMKKTEILVAQASFEIVKATVAQFPNGYVDWIISMRPTCSQVLSNCSFYGNSFECCRAAQIVYTFDMMCYHIDVNQIPNLADNKQFAIGGQVDDPIKVETSGLVVNVSFNWEMASYFEETAKDGFHLVLGHIMSSRDSPAAIPSGADALVTIATTKQDESTNCLSNNSLPPMKYFDYYDPFGRLTYIERAAVVPMINIVGCDSPLLTHYLSNESHVPACPIEAVSFMKLFAGMADQLAVGKKTIIKGLDYNQNMRTLLHSCVPVCNRWEYNIATASYGYVHYNNQTEWDRPRRDDGKAWSRIRIFFPASSYLWRVEQPPSPAYVAICDAGGSMGFYIGVSVISFVQLFVYGIFVFYVFALKNCKRKNRVDIAKD